MREIKFRAWDTKNKHFLSQQTSYVISFEGEVMERESDTLDDAGYVMEGNYLIEPNIILLQYTGLKDKNGVEIYEGDIIAHNATWYSGKKIKAVRWDDNCWETGQSDHVSDGECGPPRPEDVEIIGNIYEHPDLLT